MTRRMAGRACGPICPRCGWGGPLHTSELTITPIGLIVYCGFAVGQVPVVIPITHQQLHFVIVDFVVLLFDGVSAVAA